VYIVTNRPAHFLTGDFLVSRSAFGLGHMVRCFFRCGLSGTFSLCFRCGLSGTFSRFFRRSRACIFSYRNFYPGGNICCWVLGATAQ
jgi:hypothetical protein